MQLETIAKELARFNITDIAIAELSRQYMPLTIKDLDDKEGLSLVHKARIHIKTKRIDVEKTRKALKEDALRYGQTIDKEAKRIMALLEPIEDHLNDEENRIEEEKARIKAEADAKEAAKIQGRINKLFDLGCRYDGTTYSYGTLVAPQNLIKACTDEQFETLYNAIKEAVEKEAQQKEAEEKARQEESARLLKIAKEQQEERNRLSAEYKALQEEKNRILQEKTDAENAKRKEEQEKIRVIELEKAKLEAAEKARIETEERIKREALEKEAKEKAIKLRAERKEARRPDKEKLLSFLDVITNTSLPEMKTEEGKATSEVISTILQKAITEIKQRIDML